MKINANDSIGILNQIRKTGNETSRSLNRLSTGKKINSAKDGPAQLALIEKLKSSSKSLEVSNRNISQARATLETAEGGLSGVRENLQRARELAVQASNGTLSDADRANLEREFSQVKQEIDRTSEQTSFGSTKVLDGSFSASIQTGGAASDNQTITTGDASTEALGINNSSISTQASAQNALDEIDSAIAQANATSASIGAQQNGLEYRENANAIARENIEAARSSSEDLDYAEETAEQSRTGIQQQAQLAVLKAQLGAKKSLASALVGLKK